MQYLFLLSKEDINMSRDEVLSLAKCKKFESIGNLLILNSSKRKIDFLANRLGFTKCIFRLLFRCNKNDLIKNIERYNWNKIYEKDFALRVEGKNKSLEKNLARYIWRKIKNPKVNLKNPTTSIHLFLIDDLAICCKLETQIKFEFEERKPHMRPEFHPTSLNPRLARVLINLSGIKKGELIDLFCGSGGILMEAGLMGLMPVGYDIDKIMINRARINLVHYGVNHFILKKEDALNVKRKIKYLVSDLPYGKNTKGKDFQELYVAFLSKLREVLVGRAVIILPKFKGRDINYKEIIEKNKLKIVNQYDKYIHNTLSRKIFVLER